MKIISYNINGIRAAVKKGFLEWLKAANPDIIVLQEVKATKDQAPIALFEEMGYQVYWHDAEKKGYSGVALLTKIKPDHIAIGMGNDKYDKEGRVIRMDYGELSIMGVYMPSGSSGDERQQFKFEWLDDFYTYINELRKERSHLVIGGDYNICHTSIDIHNPKANAKTSGFLPEEREWVSKFIDSGFIDTFRKFNPEPHQYSWWSYRANARAKNLGWRIDYNMASENLNDRLKRAAILTEAKHSDHAPVLLELID